MVSGGHVVGVRIGDTGERDAGRKRRPAVLRAETIQIQGDGRPGLYDDHGHYEDEVGQAHRDHLIAAGYTRKVVLHFGAVGVLALAGAGLRRLAARK